MIDQKEVLSKVDIADVISRYIPITTRGKSLLAICPFHDDHDPSMYISRDKQIFKCFTCGTGGNAITFVQKYENIPYIEALRKVALIAGMEVDVIPTKSTIPQEILRLYKLNDEVTKYANYMLRTDEGKEALTYLRDRHVEMKAIDKFNVGFIPDKDQLKEYLLKKGYSDSEMQRAGLFDPYERCLLHRRISFPILNKEGHCAGFTARKVFQEDTAAKYMNTPDCEVFKKGSLLYNLANAVGGQGREIIITEGTMDVIALDKVGRGNGIAPLGTAFTKEAASLLKKLNLNVCVCYDGDRAGRQATVKTYHLLREIGIVPRIAIMPVDKDPDELSIEDPESLQKLLSEKNNIFDFYLKTMPSFDNFQDKQAYILNFMMDLKNEDMLFHDEYLHQLADATNLEKSTLQQRFLAIGGVGSKEHKRAVVTPEADPVKKDKKKSLIKFDVKQKLEYKKELTKNYDKPYQKGAVIAFDQTKVLQRCDILEKYIYLRGPVLESVITCLNEKDIDYKAQSVCQNAIKSICEENKIAKANVTYIAYLHKDTTFPHIHLQVWQKEPYLSQYQLNAEFLSKLQANVDRVLATPADLSVNPFIEQEAVKITEDTVIGM